MAIVLADVVGLAASVLNASPSTYGTIDDPLHPSDELEAAALNADRQIIAVILDTPGHRSIRDFAAYVPVADGGLIPERFEGGVKIDGKSGKPKPPDVVHRLKTNPNTLETTEGYYCIEGGAFFFTGTLGEVEVISFTPSGSLSAPDEYLMGVVTGLLAIVFPKEGTNVAAANHFAGLFSSVLQMIRTGATNIPAPTPFKSQ
jgi:hypothetical protein